MNTWDVVLLRFPFTSGTEAKQRPAVVISKNEDHNVGDDAIFLLITSNVTRTGPYDVLIEDTHPEYKFTGLRKTSAIRVDKIQSLTKNLVSRRLGNLGEGQKAEVRKKLAALTAI